MLKEDKFECYQPYKRPSSLGKSVLIWAMVHLFLLIFFLPISIYLFISLFFSICCCQRQKTKPVQKLDLNKQYNPKNQIEPSSSFPLLFNRCVLYLFIASLLISLYLIDLTYDSMKHLHLEENFTLTPYVIFILFKDAIVYTLNLRIILLKAYYMFRNDSCCKTFYIPYFKWILENYYIWGVRINRNCKRSSVVPSQAALQPHKSLNYESKYSSLEITYGKYGGICGILCNVHTLYDIDEYILFITSLLCGMLFVLGPCIYYIMTNCNTHEAGHLVVLSWLLFSIGVLFKIFTIFCAGRFIELIFQGFQLYYGHMKQLSIDIEIKSNNCNNDVDRHYEQIKERLKKYDDIKQFDSDKYAKKKLDDTYGQLHDAAISNIDDNQSVIISTFMIDINRQKDRYQQTSNCCNFANLFKKSQESVEQNLNDRIMLYDNDYCVIWFENWCRIEKLSSLYFHNRQNIVFGIISSTLAAITLLFLQIFVWNVVIDEFNLSCFCGLFYVIIIVLRFIIWSFKFSKLEQKHIRLIRMHQMYIKHKAILLLTTNDDQKDDDDDDDEKEDLKIMKAVKRYDYISKYLEGVIKYIEDRSLCPKIAGVTLNKAFIQLTITSVGTYIFAIIVYQLRKSVMNQ